MKAKEIINKILENDFDNNCCGTFRFDIEPCDKDEKLQMTIDSLSNTFGDGNIVIAPKPYREYVYEWVDIEQYPRIGEPDAIYMQPSPDGSMIIYFYLLDD